MGGVIDDRSVDFVVTLRSGRDSIERESERVGPGISGESGGKSGRKGGAGRKEKKEETGAKEEGGDGGGGKKRRKVDRGLAVVATVKVELTPSCHV